MQRFISISRYRRDLSIHCWDGEKDVKPKPMFKSYVLIIMFNDNQYNSIKIHVANRDIKYDNPFNHSSASSYSYTNDLMMSRA